MPDGSSRTDVTDTDQGVDTSGAPATGATMDHPEDAPESPHSEHLQNAPGAHHGAGLEMVGVLHNGGHGR